MNVAPHESTASMELTELISDLEPGRKGEILGAAASVFVDRGYEAGSMRDIATRVGVSEPALYRHFPGKEAIFVALMRLVSGRMRAESLALIDSIRPEGLREQLVAAFAGRRRVIAAYAPVVRAIVSAATHNPRFLAEYRQLMIEPVAARVIIKAAELDEAFAVPDAEVTRPGRVRALMALFVGFFVSSLVLADEPEEAIADAVLRIMRWDGTPLQP